MNSNSEKNEIGQASELKENLNIMRQIPFFSTLPLDTLKVFAYLCNRENFKSNDFLFQKDEDDAQAFYIISGRARLIYEKNGNVEEIADYEAGDFLGGLTLLGPMPRLFSLMAATDTTCLIMTREKFAKIIAQFPGIMERILSALINRIYTWEKQRLTDHAETCQDCLKRTGVSLI